MTMMLRFRSYGSLGLGLLLTAGAATGCPSDDSGEENVLPSGTGSDSMTSASSDTETTDTTDTAGEVMFPATYRFDCIDVRGIGNGGPDVLQARLLEDAWSADIQNYKLNIMMEIFSLDEAGGMGEIGIRSGVGAGPTDLCAEPSSASGNISVAFTPGATTWVPTNDAETCSSMEAGEGFGDFALDLGPNDLFYIYAEDDTTVTFNCTADAAIPDAVPIRAVQAQVPGDATQTRISGSLVGCLVQAEAMSLCSCLGACLDGEGNVAQPGEVQADGNCAGCPNGSVPLEDLLGNVGTSDRCTDLMGEPAFDLDVGFSATVLPNSGTALTTCGG